MLWMEPEVQRRQHEDGSVTFSLTMPPATSKGGMLAAEERLVAAMNAVGRAATQHLLGGFDADGQPLEIGGRKFTSKGKVDKIYECPWGEVMLARHLYQHSGGGTTFCPLEADARIVGGSATPHLARSLSHKVAYASAQAVVRDLQDNHGRKLAPSYVLDLGNAVAAAASQPVVERTAYSLQTPPAQVASAILSLDGTCAYFRKEGYKHCMVGTISLYNANCERLETIYLAQAPETGKTEFLARLDAEWERVVARYPAAHKVGLSDGARDYETWLASRTTWGILDFYHATGYLAGAAPGLRRKKSERTVWLDEACHALKHDMGAAQRLSDELAAQVQAGSRTASAAEPLAAAAGYLGHNVGRMNYPVFRAMGFPIGSGVIEAGCKVVVKARLCGSGMKWTRAGAQSILTLRSLLLSTDRWTALWRYLDKNGIS